MKNFKNPEKVAENILSNRGRIRLLGILSKEGPLYLNELLRASGLNSAQAEKHLECLLDIDVLKEDYVGRFHIYQTNFKRLEFKFSEKGISIAIE